MDKNQATRFKQFLSILGLVLVGKGLFYWIDSIGIMYGYAQRGIIDNYSYIFFFSILLFTAIIILGIYFSDLGAINVSRDLRKRVLTLRKDIPGRRVMFFLGLEFLGTIFVLLKVPEFPRFYFIFVFELIMLIWAIIRREE